MQCPRCQHDNRPQAKFCEECAAPLARTCPNCGTQVSPEAKFCSECAHAVTGPVSTHTRYTSPETYTPKHLAEKILTSKSRPRRRAQAGDGPLRRPQGLDGAPRRPGPRGGAEAPGPGARAHDGGRPPLRGHGEPGDGRRDHGPLRRAGGPRGPRRAGVLRRPRHAGGDSSRCRGGPAASRGRDPDPRRPELGRGGRARHRQRSADGLHGGRADHAPGRAHGAARQARHDPADRRRAPSRGRVHRGHAARPGARQGPERAGRPL